MTALSMEEAIARSKAVEAVVVGSGVVQDAGRIFRQHFGDGPALLFADDNTYRAAGEATRQAFADAGLKTRCHILPASPRPKPSVDLAEKLQAALEAGETPVAIGSGVLNDVVKYAAFKAGLPYMVVATAASMDGYTSAGAPLSVGGFKMTIQCQPARVLLADLEILAAAPPDMAGWGFGDLAGKVPAGGDWIVADALGVEPIDDVAWPLVQTDLKRRLDAAEAVGRADPDAIAELFEGLTLVGLAMELYGSSRPASGADHQIAHLWEMEGLSQDGEVVSHGSCVSVATMATARLFDWVLDQDLTAIDVDDLVARAPDLAAKEQMMEEAFGKGEIVTRSMDETAAKHAEGEALRQRLGEIVRTWPTLRQRLQDHVLRADTIAERLGAAGAPIEAADIGVLPDHLRRTVLSARFMRSRYTILDLLDETGLLPQAMDAVFANPPGAMTRGAAQ